MEEENYRETLRQLLEEIEQQISALRLEEERLNAQFKEQLGLLESKHDQLEAQKRHLHALLTLRGESTASPRDSTKAPEVQARSLPIQDEVFNLLKAAGEGMHYKEITNRLEIMGRYIDGKDPAATVVSRIYQDPRFIRPNRGVYALREWYPKSTKSVGTRQRKRRRSRSLSKKP